MFVGTEEKYTRKSTGAVRSVAVQDKFASLESGLKQVPTPCALSPRTDTVEVHTLANRKCRAINIFNHCVCSTRLLEFIAVIYIHEIKIEEHCIIALKQTARTRLG